MCKPHWNQYTAGLASDAKARTADKTEASAADPEPIETKPSRVKGEAKEQVVATANGGAE